jgi:hypothetical protein
MFQYTGELCLSCGSEVGGSLASRICQPHSNSPPILRVTAPLHPAARFEQANAATDGTFDEVQPSYEVVLRKRRSAGEFHQRMRFRNRHWLTARGLVRTMQPKSTNERNHLLLQRKGGGINGRQ